MTAKLSCRYFLVIAVPLFLAPLAVQASCGSAFCPLHTEWDIQGAAVEHGTRLGLRFEYIDQDQPRNGKDEVAVGEIPGDHDEVRTINRNWVLSVEHAFSKSWGVSATLPVVNRSHGHIHNDLPDSEFETWNFSEIGDARVQGWYRPEQSNSGFLFGAKLPTGDSDITNDDGEVAERTLQPGTGTTDALLGAFYRIPVPGSSSTFFVQASWQHALNDHNDFEPGDQVIVDGGYRYDVSPKVALMAQLNALTRDNDSGSEAEPDDSGGDYLFFSPGVSYTVGAMQVYGFFQLPLYQNVNGVQLTADSAVVVGISGRI